MKRVFSFLRRWLGGEADGSTPGVARSCLPETFELHARMEEAIRTEDRSIIDTAAGVASGHVPEDMRLQIYGVGLFETGFHDDGLNVLGEAWKCKSSRDNALILAYRLMVVGRDVDAGVLYYELLSRDPEDCDALLGCAEIMAKAHRWSEVAAYADRAIAACSESGKAYHWAAIAANVRDDVDIALGHVRRAIGIGMEDRAYLALAWKLRAGCEVTMGDFNSARRSAEKCLSIDPDQDIKELMSGLDGCEEFGTSYYLNGFYKIAYPWLCFESTREPVPGEVSLYRAAAEAKLKEDITPLMKCCKIVGANVPQDMVHEVIGETAFYLGMEDQGIEEMRKAVGISPSAFNIASLADALDDRGEVVEAETLFEQVLATDVEHPMALSFMARHAENSEDALSLFLRVRDMAPEEAYGQFDVAAKLEDMGKYDAAIHEYRKLLELEDPAPELTWAGLGRCFLELGQRQKAKECLREALWYDCSCEDAKELALRIDS